MNTIYLAGGCFWGMQKFIDQFDGVTETEVGYANGPDKAPSYQEVCKSSGHAETVRVVYDPGKISLTRLLDYYFMVIDPLSVNRQGNDIGIQYRTGIYYTDEGQLLGHIVIGCEMLAEKIRAIPGFPEKKAAEPLNKAVKPANKTKAVKKK